jgi:uncharacterized protein YkwD
MDAFLKRILIFCLFFTPLFATAQRAANFDPQAESEFVKLINQERTERGLGPLLMDDRLTLAARRHTELMIGKHELTHKLVDEQVLRDRVALTGIDFEIAGENVAYDADTPHSHDAFMHSPGHRANILNPKFNAVGIGVMRSGNLMWVTEDFAQRLGVTSALEAARIIKTKYGDLRKKAGSPAAAEKTIASLGHVACDMARADKLDTQSPRSLPNVRGVMAWTAADPAKLPRQVTQLADDRQATKYSLGVCFASSSSYPNKVFWLVMAIY